MGHQKEVEKAHDSYMRFLRLCKLLLKNNMTANEIPADNEFYELARQTAKECGVSWDDMDFPDSDAIMLDMLFNAWNDINVAPNVDIEVKFKVYGKTDNGNPKRKRPA